MTRTLKLQKFAGQHEDERVLYVVRPDPWGRAFVISKAMTVAVVIALLVSYFLLTFTDHTAIISSGYGIASGVFVALLLFGWPIYQLFIWRAYITDRRFVRFEAVFPCFVNRRSLLWENVGKVKSISQGLLLRACKIGLIELHASFEKKENILLPYVYYYEDLANYLEKVLHTYKKDKDNLGKIRPFVTRPKWKRYPLEEGALLSDPAVNDE